LWSCIFAAVEGERPSAGERPLARPPFVQEELGQVEVGLFPRHAIELSQADLDLLVARDVAQFAGSEGPDEEVGILDGDVKEGAFAGRLKMCDGGLEHVPRIVELVAAAEIIPTLGTGPGSGFRGSIVRAV
jgi:hypothetical protein